ncbi:aromatic compound dioxygenase [Cylindrobasidium torrendii FP15055 ss-10]|uniref:Aromatic compound dioxygenase n=1 Tax=Cylindrobasidium torrendii FP15055 ss-10 TaxID=1314674 RepID=A0A0D7BHA7_9AGAR|nr:aromatic compound dioxygenase [Cylindrobasidium torrendii FP15055 ss-10]
MHLASLVSILSLSAYVLAHGGHTSKRQEKRDLSHCSREISATKQKRSPDVLDRMTALHGTESVKRSSLEERAIFSELANNTCVIDPEVTSGPYHIDGQLYRRDVREHQPGIPMWIDIGVIDIDTCEPLENVMLEFWHCNATGYYSGYTGIDPDTMEYTLPERDDGTTDDLTFLRGFQKSNANGIAEFVSIFPGWYNPRAVHIHIVAHLGAEVAENGTIIGGSQVHVGQLFFDEELTKTVHESEHYVAHSQANRPTVDHDQVYPQSNTTAWSPIVEVVTLGETLSEGLLGYITIAVSSSGNITTSDPGLHTSGGTSPTNTIAAANGAYASASAHDVSLLKAENIMSTIFKAGVAEIMGANATPTPSA